MSLPNNSYKKQKAAEGVVDDFRQRLGPFVVAAEKTRMAMAFTNAKQAGNPIVFANHAFRTLTGFHESDVLGTSLDAMMARGASAEALAEIAAAFAGTDDAEPEIRYRRQDGSAFWASVFVTPVCDESGDIVEHFVSLVDLTRRREQQEHCEMLIDELNHRVKNTLSTVQSITRQPLRTETDPQVIRESIDSRIFALSRSHDLLTHENWQGAGLHDLIDAALEPFGVAGGRTERFQVDGANIRLTPKAALALGIAFHELATNAVKYGAFSNEAGTIAIAWTIEPSTAGNRLVLHWREKDGPRVSPPTRKGFGSQVLERGLAHELEGKVKLDYHPEGVVCTIDIPSPRETSDD